MRSMPYVRSATSLTFDLSTASQKLGQPVPESNFVSDLKRPSPQQTHLYIPTPLWFQYFPEKGRSVALQRATSYCSAVSFCFHSLSRLASGFPAMRLQRRRLPLAVWHRAGAVSPCAALCRC